MSVGILGKHCLYHWYGGTPADYYNTARTRSTVVVFTSWHSFGKMVVTLVVDIMIAKDRTEEIWGLRSGIEY